MTNTVQTIAANLGVNLIAFRSTTVAAENKGDVTSRSLFAAMLVDKDFTADLATAAILHSFGNPKGAKGKAIDKLSGLRNITGGDAVRKMATSVFNVMTNIDADKSTTGDVRKTVTAFVLSETGAPKSLRALVDSVSIALRAHIKATQPANAEAEADNAQAEADAVADANGDTPAVAPLSLIDHINQLTLRLSTTTPEQRADMAIGDALGAMLDSWNAMIDADETAELMALESIAA